MASHGTKTRTDRLIPSLLIFSSSFSLSSSNHSSQDLLLPSSNSLSLNSSNRPDLLLPSSNSSSELPSPLLPALSASHSCLLRSCHSCFNSSPDRTLKTCHTLFPSISFHPPEKLKVQMSYI